jgi:hypothetical protein
MPFAEGLGTITCNCVLRKAKPVLWVSRAGGDWQMYCHWANHDFEAADALATELTLVHVAHLLASDSTLEAVSDLPIDMAAERTVVGGVWERYEDKDDE